MRREITCAAQAVVPQSATVNGGGKQHPRRVEWPTIAVAVAVWALWAVLVFAHRSIPTPLLLLGFAVSNAWYMSLQHEVIHGHPTPWRVVNAVVAWMPLNLWLPFSLYRDSHLVHHEADLTIPEVDPESYYVTPAQWAAAGPFKRAVLMASRTFVGRMVLGPAIGPTRTVVHEMRRALTDAATARVWVAHVVGAAAVGWVVFGIAGVPVWQYLVGYCYLGMSVVLIRSFAEHLAVPAPATRSAVVRSGWFFGLLFLNNNLHHTHHARPAAAWYRLPALTDEIGSEALAAQGAGLYRSYGEVMRRFAFHPFPGPVNPLLVDDNVSV